MSIKKYITKYPLHLMLKPNIHCISTPFRYACTFSTCIIGASLLGIIHNTTFREKKSMITQSDNIATDDNASNKIIRSKCPMKKIYLPEHFLYPLHVPLFMPVAVVTFISFIFTYEISAPLLLVSGIIHESFLKKN